MNTAPLQNPAGLLQNAPPTARQSDANPAQTPFNQVLANEVAQRRDAGNADGKTAPAKPGEGDQTPAAADNDGTPLDKARAQAKSDEAERDGAASVVPASAELLALVADLQRANGTGAGPDGAEDSAAAVTAKVGKQDATLAIDPDLSRASSKKDAILELAGSKIRPPADGPVSNGGKIELPADGSAPAGPATEPASDSALKPEPTFATAMKQAGESKTAPDPSLLKNLDSAATPAPAIAQLAPSALQANQGVPVQAADKLTPQVGTPAWDSALGQKVVWMAAGAQQSASLSLNPPDLGPLQVVLHVNNSHANATFISAQPEVRQALEAAMPRLREMMGDAGIQLGQANVSTGTPDQQPAWSEQAPRQAMRGNQAIGRDADTAVHSGQVAVTGVGRGLVDTFA